MNELNGCQIPCLPQLADGPAENQAQTPFDWLKSRLALPWNAAVKPNLKRAIRWLDHARRPTAVQLPASPAARLQAGDWVRVRPREEIAATLDRFQELKGCAFLDGMWLYCGTRQRVLVAMERFLDERDYKVKKVRGVVLLKGVLCAGTPVFGRCDRCCHLFWREEWLERIDPGPQTIRPG
ncbi:MAG TPA: hypothetical protein VFF68_07115 [Anaerolineaceae bacterium]|nr:hypothetical protein [Anaerolineaceae bacterium]